MLQLMWLPFTGLPHLNPLREDPRTTAKWTIMQIPTTPILAILCSTINRSIANWTSSITMTKLLDLMFIQMIRRSMSSMVSQIIPTCRQNQLLVMILKSQHSTSAMMVHRQRACYAHHLYMNRKVAANRLPKSERELSLITVTTAVTITITAIITTITTTFNFYPIITITIKLYQSWIIHFWVLSSGLVFRYPLKLTSQKKVLRKIRDWVMIIAFGSPETIIFFTISNWWFKAIELIQQFLAIINMWWQGACWRRALCMESFLTFLTLEKSYSSKQGLKL